MHAVAFVWTLDTYFQRAFPGGGRASEGDEATDIGDFFNYI